MNVFNKIHAPLLLAFLLALQFGDCHSLNGPGKKTRQPYKAVDCEQVPEFTSKLREQVRSKAADVNRIIDFVLEGKEKHSTYDELALFCDLFGPRLSGSSSLDRAIDYMSHKMTKESKLKAWREKAMIPKWEVGSQWAEIVKPVAHRMSILALGYSVGTSGTLEAEAQLVNSFEQLKQLGLDGQIQGKIVVYNYNFTSYGESVKFRSMGALEAAKYGAAAALVRSVTPYSIYSPHAGAGSKSIPTAAITVEDADKLQRWTDRRQAIRLRVFIEAQNYDSVESANLIGDIVGSQRPDQVVLVSGHMDSWYNTDGAMDDGGGMMISYKALDVLSKLQMRARRTIRAVLWTAEEPGLVGVQQYFREHKGELANFSAVMESDLGTFRPRGLSHANFGPLGQCVVRELLELTRPKLDTGVFDSSYEGSDIALFTDAGVPGLSLNNANERYFWYHHTSGDSISMENPDDLDRCTALWAAAAYVLADVDVADYRL